MRRALFILLATLCVHSAMAVMVFPSTGTFYPGIDEDSMRVKLSQMDLQPIEGIWYYPAEDLTVAIVRMPSDRFFSPQHPPYQIVLLSSPDINVLPGTEIGFIVAGALDEEFDLYMFTECDDEGNVSKPKMCYAKMTKDASTITFVRPKKGVDVRINFARFLPSIFKGVSIVPKKKEKKVAEGFRKVYPADGNGNPFDKVRYL